MATYLLFAVLNCLHLINSGSAESALGPMCYHCDSEVYPDTCLTVKQCGAHEICYLEQYENTLGVVMYKSGCKANFECQSLNQSLNARIRRSVDTTMCSECCHGDYCNNAGCGYKAIPNASFAGLLCYHCERLTDTYGCTHLQRCDSTELCYIERNNGSGHHKSGCKPKHQCPGTNTSDRCDACCSNNFCNKDCQAIQGLTTKASSTSHVTSHTKHPISYTFTTNATSSKPSTSTRFSTVSSTKESNAISTRTSTVTTRAATRPNYVVSTNTITTGTSSGPMCYSCDAEVFPNTCKNLTQCGSHEKCYLEKYENTLGVKIYRSGCKANFICENGKQGIHHKRSVVAVMCSVCCNGSYCNNVGCGFEATTQTTHFHNNHHHSNHHHIHHTKTSNMHSSVSSVLPTTPMESTTDLTNKSVARSTSTISATSKPSKTYTDQTTTGPSIHHPSGPMCYSCEAEVFPNTCKNLTRCGTHEKCHLEKYENTLGVYMYRSGCKAKFVCDNENQNVLRRRSVVTVVCSECCNSSYCNNIGCGFQAMTQTTHTHNTQHHSHHHHTQNVKTSVAASSPTPAILSKFTTRQLTNTDVHNTLESSSTRIQTYTTTLGQTNTTQSTLIPSGPICYGCEAEVFPSTCKNLTQCGTHEKCHLEKYENTLGVYMYRSGCKAKFVCDNENQNILRRRSAVTVVCSECCGGSYCNNNGCGFQATAQTTHIHNTQHHSHHHHTQNVKTSDGASSPTPATISKFITGQLTNTAHNTLESSSTRMQAFTTTLGQTNTTQSTLITSGPTCYGCEAGVFPSTCKNFTQCGIHEKCHLEKYENTLGVYMYRSGCKAKFVCDNEKQNILRRRSAITVVCSECCDGSYCNNDGCGFQAHTTIPGHLQTTKMINTSIPAPTSASTTGIMGTATTNTDVSKSTSPSNQGALISSAVPSVTKQPLNGSGPLCALCNNIRDPHSCKHVVRCQQNEQCMAMFYTDSTHQRIHTLGCMPSQICASFHRYYHGEDRCEQCCTNGDACNSHGCPLVGDIGPVCYNCSNTQTPYSCNNLQLCENDEECFIDLRNDYGKLTFDSGCRKLSVCQRYHDKPVIENNLIRSCCSTPLCNNNGEIHKQLLTTTTTTKTTKTTATTTSSTSITKATTTTTASVPPTTTTTITTTKDLSIHAALDDVIKISCTVPDYINDAWWESPQGNRDHLVERYLGQNVYELVILFIQREDSGLYRCMVGSRNGYSYAVKETMVIVQ